MPHSVELAKALACSRAVSFARELSFFQVVFEGDSLRIIQAINSQGANLRCLVILQRKFTAYGLYSSSFNHAKRKGNKLANALVRRAVLFVDTTVWVEDLPSNLDDVFVFDLVHR